MKQLSIIIPCYNEEENLNEFNNVITKTLKNTDFELIYVDDGSSDKTLLELQKIYKKQSKNTKVISFSRNFHKDAAIYAGLSNANGEYCCIIDADLQQNPKYILEMLDFIVKNPEYDQIAMINNQRIENFLVKFLKNSFYRFINFLSDTNFVQGASDFRLMKRSVVNAILSLPENNKFSKGIFSWVGFKTHYLTYKVEARKHGESKFGLKNSFKYAYEGIIGFSVKPLKIASYTGAVSAIIAFALFIEVLIEKIFFNHPIAGYPTIMCAILFIGGIQLITIGILGEYLAKTYIETKHRPIYIIKEQLGINNKKGN